MEPRLFIFCFAAILSFLSAVMSFLMIYEEDAHHYADKRKLLKTALKAAIFTLVFFLVLGLLLGFILQYLMSFRGTK